MTKKHFKRFAEEIKSWNSATEFKSLENELKIEMAMLVSRVSKEFNPNFKQGKFLRACGLDLIGQDFKPLVD